MTKQQLIQRLEILEIARIDQERKIMALEKKVTWQDGVITQIHQTRINEIDAKLDKLIAHDEDPYWASRQGRFA